MKYNFDRVIDRRITDSIKWGDRERNFDRDVIPMWIADMDFESPAPVIEAITARARQGVYGYPMPTPTYYGALIEWMEKRHGWTLEREWLSHSPGVVPALNYAVQAYTQPGDKIIVQPPVYFPFFSAVTNNGRHLVFNPLKFEDGTYRMDLEDLEKKMDPRAKLLILCSPHNPVGRVWSAQELAQLGEVCLRNNLIILSDEIHGDLILSGHKHTSLAMLSDALAQNTLTCIAPSKTFNLAGLFTSVAIIPNPRLRVQVNAARDNAGVASANIFGIAGLDAAYRAGEEWLDQVLDYLQGNLNFLMDYFHACIPEIKPIRPEGTYLVWLDCRGLGMTDAALKEWMLKKVKVTMNEGAQFGIGGEGFMRMNIGCPRALLVEALQRIERAVRG
ncbi:cystathione beta-lyase [Anaerolineae bacterium]|nr:cystathione beta-lyase [Anaerolineae bacterium]